MIMILPLWLRAFLQKFNNFFISVFSIKWIVCFIKIKSKVSLFCLKKVNASIFLKLIRLSLSTCLSKSIPVGLDLSFSLLAKWPKILPRPHPISIILEALVNLVCLIKNLLKNLI